MEISPDPDSAAGPSTVVEQDISDIASNTNELQTQASPPKRKDNKGKRKRVCDRGIVDEQ